MWENIKPFLTKDFFESLSILILALSATYKVIKELYEKRKKSKGKNILKQIINNQNVHDKIVECRIEFEANRVNIIQLHNGDYYSNNSSILKMSISNETTDSSTPEVMQDFQNILVTRFNKLILDLSTKGMYIVPNVDELKDFKELKDELHFRGVKSYYAVALNNSYGKMVGYLTLIFCDNVVKDIDMDKLNQYASKVAYMLNKNID